MTLASDSEQVLKKRADASFRKEERVKDGKKGAADYEAEGRAVAAKTARLTHLSLLATKIDDFRGSGKQIIESDQWCAVWNRL
jgi:hypothetical protein